jgi:hypothetical protein
MSSNNYFEIKVLDFCLQEVTQSTRIMPNETDATNSRIIFILLLEFNIVV